MRPDVLIIIDHKNKDLYISLIDDLAQYAPGFVPRQFMMKLPKSNELEYKKFILSECVRLFSEATIRAYKGNFETLIAKNHKASKIEPIMR